jgi:hypothetical protein
MKLYALFAILIIYDSVYIHLLYCCHVLEATKSALN